MNHIYIPKQKDHFQSLEVILSHFQQWSPEQKWALPTPIKNPVDCGWKGHLIIFMKEGHRVLLRRYLD